MKSKKQKQEEAAVRKAAFAKLSFEDKLRKAGARERARLLKRGR